MARFFTEGPHVFQPNRHRRFSFRSIVGRVRFRLGIMMAFGWKPLSPCVLDVRRHLGDSKSPALPFGVGRRQVRFLSRPAPRRPSGEKIPPWNASRFPIRRTAFARTRRATPKLRFFPMDFGIPRLRKPGESFCGRTAASRIFRKNGSIGIAFFHRRSSNSLGRNSRDFFNVSRRTPQSFFGIRIHKKSNRKKKKRSLIGSVF